MLKRVPAKAAFVGTGTCNPLGRGLPCLALSDGESVTLVDCGGGSYHRLALLGEDAFLPAMIDRVLLTHYHTDHVSGLPDLLWGEMWRQEGHRTRPLVLAGPSGLGDFLHRCVLPLLGGHPVPFEIVLHELSGGDSLGFGDMTARAFPAAHGNAALGYLVEHPKGALAVSGDTALCGGLRELLGAASAAVVEWSMPGESSHGQHMGAVDFMRLAREGLLPQRVFVTHMYFFSGSDPRVEIAWKKELMAAEGRPDILFPDDGDIVLL